MINIINISYLKDEFTGKRNYKIFENLINQNGIFSKGVFVNPPIVLDTKVSLMERLRSLISIKTKIYNPKIKIISPEFFIPFTYRSKKLMKFQSKVISKRILRLLPKESPFILWINNPEYTAYFITLELIKKANGIVFDLSDDFSAFEHENDFDINNRLEFLIEKSDLLICVNEHVYKKYNHKAKIVFHNCTSFKNFQKENSDFTIKEFIPKNSRSKYIGFIGGLNKGRLDLPLLEKLLKQFFQHTFLFVGFTNDESLLKKLSEHQNFNFIPAVPYHELPHIIKSFDVAIIPHLINEHTAGNDLLKVLDYLACGVPVVSTKCSGVNKYKDYIYLSEDSSHFCSLVGHILSDKIDHDPIPGKQISEKKSWENTVPKLEEQISRKLLITSITK